MKLLCFTDPHGDLSALISVRKKAKKADIIVCSGDISLFESNLDYTLFELNRIGKPLVIIHGNHEDWQLTTKICSLLENIHYIHKSFYIFNDTVFLGYGEGVFTRTSPEFDKFVQKNKNKLKGKKIVLLTHAPPYGTKLDMFLGEHTGNKSVRKFVDKYQPKLVITGHYHEHFNKSDKVGKTNVVNPGQHGKIIEI